MKQGNAVTPSITKVNYGEGFGTFGVIKDRKEALAASNIAFDANIDVPLFSAEMSKFGPIGVKSTFLLASAAPANEELLVNKAEEGHADITC